MGFEPMIRVLQTLALPLGHVAGESASGGRTPLIKKLSGRRDSNP